MNPLERAHESALRQNERIGQLFARVGTTAYPNGFTVAAYRQASRAIQSAMNEEHPALAVLDVMNELKRSVVAGTKSVLADAVGLGTDEAGRQLRFYGRQSDPKVKLAEATQASVDAVASRIDSQTAMISALIITGADPGQIVGTPDQVGVLQASTATSLISQLAANLVWQSFAEWISSFNQEQVFKKQVVAALDERTTVCCLEAHGQIQPMNKMFELTGWPRFSDHMDWAPFHRWCRTSIVIYQEQYDLGLTDQMRVSAQEIMNVRAAGGSGYRNPADAFS